MSDKRNMILVAGIVAALMVCTAASADPPARVGRLALYFGAPDSAIEARRTQAVVLQSISAV